MLTIIGQPGFIYMALDVLLVVAALLAVATGGSSIVTRARRHGPPLFLASALAGISYDGSVSGAVASAAAFALLVVAQHRLGFALFHAANALGIYRAVSSGNVPATAARTALLLFNIGQTAHQALRVLASRAFFVREIRLIRLNRLRKLALGDIWELPSRFKAEDLRRRFAYDVNQRFFLARAIVRLMWRPLLPLVMLHAAANVLRIAKFAAGAHMAAYISAPFGRSWYHGCAAVLCEFLASVACSRAERMLNHTWDEVEFTTRVLPLELFCLPLTRANGRRHCISRQHKEAVDNIVDELQRLAMLATRIFSIPMMFAALYYHVGWLALVPIAGNVAINAANRLCRLLLGSEDQWTPGLRVFYDSKADEIYSGIRTVKLFGWERMHTDRGLLQLEAPGDQLPWYAPVVRIIYVVNNAVFAVSFVLPAYIMSHIHIRAHLSAAVSSHAYIGVINAYNHAHNLCIETERMFDELLTLRNAAHSISRLERALRGKPFNALPQDDSTAPEKGPAVNMSECSFIWNKRVPEPVLENVSLDAKDGELVAVVGKTGSGKSSLLLAVCGELEMASGSGSVTGKVAYLEQQPWIMNDTLRANVLFGREYDQAFFEQVVHACALTDDLARWPDADLTVIGERGINISGGQRARLALARALYSRADVYVLDDPLSAVDAHVKRHILDHVLLDSGMLAGKLRIVATNSDHVLPYAHQVVTLEGRCATVVDPCAGDVKETASSPVADNRRVSEVDKRSCWDNAVYIFHLCGWPVLTGIVLSSLIKPALDHIISTMQLAIGSGSDGSMSGDDVLFYLQLQVLDKITYRIGSWIERTVYEDIIRGQLEHRVKGQFVQRILHAPMLFFDGITRQHLSLREIQRESDIARSRTSFIIGDGEQMIRLLDAYQELIVALLQDTGYITSFPNSIRLLSGAIDVYRQYASIEPEAPYVVEGHRPEPSWPQAGRVEFRDFSLRYREDLPPALDGINLTIEAGEKIGIVGRTGAGKSTLAKALFRLVHGTTSGSIFVDGQDTLEMGVGDLRPRLGIIPQESTMFDGSYRKNLDPLREHTVEDMWAALIQSGIAAEVAPLRTAPGNNNSNVGKDDYDEEYEEEKAEYDRRWAESGWAMRLVQLAFIKGPQKKPEKRRAVPLHGLHRTAQSSIRGFSSGQQQLFSLCRVLMRRRRVIVLDEATANVDLATDREMQRIIRSEFKDHTVLTIAHRLETIMDCDRIVVMDRGRIAEVGPPQDLIDAGGHFAELVRANDFGS
ncbi:ATP-binding cassette glutathione S-conjugate transporter ycf1 [Coemansia javaensis]|uniref:ATP-binding cassette glutathione S-conjugate transporter ycf1 n=1 Tax=Coemansia javaensis TaxID=2761396 RepID=A0A9W8H6V3_9FUNG|nr:ATP-binding cassette glutathione S-conjugate transporter ycf1 [Coemansia javaensis]